MPDPIGWPEAMQDVMGPRQRLDLLLTMNRSQERERQFVLTQDYLSMPWVIWTRKDSAFISNIASLTGKLVAVEKGYVMQKMLRKDLPTIRFLEEANSEAALHAVATGRADACVGNLAVGAYLIRQHGLANLVVAAPTPYGDHTQAMAIRKDWAVLADQGIAAMPPEMRNNLTQKWTQVEIRAQRDYTLAWQILAVSALLITLFFYWNRRLASEIAVRKATEIELARHRSNLEMMSKSKDAAQSMVNVVNDIVDFSKDEADRLPLEGKNFSQIQLIDDAIALQKIAAEAKGLRLTRYWVVTKDDHALLMRAFCPIPRVEAGDTVWWHPDLIHGVEDKHNGKNYSNVMYIGAAPDCAKNRAFLIKQRAAFEAGKSSPDFVAEDYEVDFSNRFLPTDLTPLGRKQMGYDL